MTVELAVRMDGPPGAEPVVLLPALGTDSTIWNPQVGILAERFLVIRPDIRGHGRSPADDAPATLADLAGDVLAVLDRLDIGRAHLAGISLGGMTAMWLAANRPERVGRLAVLCSSAAPGPPAGWTERASTVRLRGLGAIVDGVVSRWITPRLAAGQPELLAALRAQLLNTDPGTYARCCEVLAGVDLSLDLPRIAAPTLVLTTAGDEALPPPHSLALAAGIEGARLEELGAAGHLAVIEQAGLIGRLLLDHFSTADFNAADFSVADAAARGRRIRREVLGDAHVDATTAAMTPLTAPFQDFLTRYAWGEVWSRPGLGRRERSIATLAVLVALGTEHEIPMHLRAARTNGLTEAEIGELLLHTALYAGLPRANRAFRLAQQEFAMDRPDDDVDAASE